MSRGGEMVYIPDDSDFSSFRDQCESLEGWHSQYNKGGVMVWSQTPGESRTVQKIKKYPPRKDFVRAVSLQTGYLVKANGPHGCTLYYLTQVDPRGSLPKWVVNKMSQFVAPKAMKKIYKAGLKYLEWKQKHEPGFKPWVYPEQNTLPSISLAELSLQHADSLENIDESGLAEDRTHISDDEA